MSYPDAFLRDILKRSRTIAMVGVSPNPVRPSYYVARYLSQRGYALHPVNPGHADKELLGHHFVAGLGDISAPVDMLDVFRRSEAVPGIVEEALALFPSIRTIWLQIGVESGEAVRMAEAAGVDIVQNRCPKIEHQRLFGELRKGGFATGVISSRL